MGVDYYKISEQQLLQLLEDNFKLQALIIGGVDNWEWYGEALNSFLKEMADKDWDFSDLAEEELQYFERMM